MDKERLREKMVDFQREIIRLSQALQAKEQAFQDENDNLMQSFFQVLDAFENIFQNLQGKEAAFDKPVRRAMASFAGIQRKILRILEAQGIEPITFPDNKATIGLCKVVETRAVTGRQDGEIISITRNGYFCKDRVLRPAEIISVKNPNRL